MSVAKFSSNSQWPFGPQFPVLQLHDSAGTSSESALLPATTSSKDHNIRKPSPVTPGFLEGELYTPRIRNIERFIWLAGRPLPPRPLHQQILLSRTIVLSESVELHLIWKRGTIFVKPLSRYLLDRAFWEEHLTGDTDDKLVNCARGLLFSYTALVRYESDFRIAQDTGLLPRSMRWDQWQNIAQAFLDRFPGNGVYAHIDPRYYYGELRLGRLNKIYRILQPRALSDLLYGYSKLTAHNLKEDTFSDNLRLIGASFAYVVIVLSAMQVGLTTDRLAGSHEFQQACYGFAVFSMIAPLIALGTVFVVFILLVVINVTETLIFEKGRFEGMQRDAPRLYKRGTRREEPVQKV